MGRPSGPSTKTVDNELFLQSLQRCAAHSNCPQLPVSRSSLNRAPTDCRVYRRSCRLLLCLLRGAVTDLSAER
jgi:hypothetical protein